jgi:hypothetical protein
MLRHDAAIERDIGTQGHPRRRRRYAGDDADNGVGRASASAR